MAILQDEDYDNYDQEDLEDSNTDPLAGPDGGEEGQRLAKYWLSMVIDFDDDKEHKRWIKRGAQIEKRYRDERSRVDEEGQRRYNSLWANVEILTPALYGKCPVPIVERRFNDKDPVGRGASQILERGLRNEIEINGFDEAMQQAVRDYLLAGLGQAWIRYEPELGEAVSVPSDAEQDMSDTEGDIEDEDDSQDEDKLRETGDRITRESIPVDFIQWTDFYYWPSRARIWAEVVAVGKRVYMTRDQMKRRFGDEIGKAIPLQKDDRYVRRQEDTSAGHEVEEKAQLYEIWSRTDETVYWIAEGYQYLADRKDDPLKLEKFFPCPKPLLSNVTNNTLVPVPDFIQYQDQAIQIDELTQRISMLAKACKVAGVYNAAAKSIQRLLNESVENELIPVDDWAAFADKGGVAGNISYLPLKEIMGVLEELMKVKQEAIQEMDRLTGINDIMRGTTDARETLGGQRLKSNSTGTRLQHRQNEVARFARDVLRLMADVMCQHFSPQSLIEVSGAMYEEGLGTMEPPSLTAIQQAQQAPATPPPQTPAGPATGIPGSQPQGSPGMPFSPPISGAQAGPTVPPQGAPPNFGPVGVPPSGVSAPPMQQPPIDPMMQIQQDQQMGLQRIAKAISLLRNEKLRGFRVDIEVDSTIYGDQQQEKGDRTAFIASVTQFLQQSMMISAQMPSAAPLLGKFLQFGVRGFKVGRDLEQAIEDFCDSAVVEAKQHAQKMASQENPEKIKADAVAMKAKADIQQTQMKMQGDQQKNQAETQRQAIDSQTEQFNAQQDAQQKQMDVQMRKMEMQIEQMRMQVEMIKAQSELKTSMIEASKPEPAPVSASQSSSLGN